MKYRVAAGILGLAGLVAAIGAVVLPGTASATSTGCSVSYTVVGQWPGGFQGGVSVTNLGDPLSSWTLAFDFPDASQKVGPGWSAIWSQTGQHVTAASM